MNAATRLARTLWDRTGGALLMRTGAAGRLTTVGRVSGALRTVQCGYVALEDGSLLVGSAEGREWPHNLAASGTCTFEARGLPPARYRATRLSGEEQADAILTVRGKRGERAAQMMADVVFRLDRET